MAATQTGAVRDDMLTVAKRPESGFEPAADRLGATPLYGSQLRTTCVTTLLSGGQVQATIQRRPFPTDTGEATQAALAKRLADPKIGLTVIEIPAPNAPSPLDPKVMKAVAAVSVAIWPGVPLFPLISVGMDDNVYTRGAGMPSFGVGGAFAEIGSNRAHARDERVGSMAF
jgi:hypothetical protein